MKKEDIKRHLHTYSVYGKRRTTINHAFASAIAPNDNYDEKRINEALEFLGQNTNEDLKCVFCNDEAETWDHLVGLVKNGELRGFGHQIGNLVPCCKKCNSKKGSKEFDKFIEQYDNIYFDKDELIDLLFKYQITFAKEIDLNFLKEKVPDTYKAFLEVKQKIFELMKEADNLAKKLRENILD
jgi:5-methylcytosine-specific restriction endonuclease McrA